MRLAGFAPASLFSLRSHAACGSKSRYDSCGHRCYDLHDELQCFSLTHNSPPSLIVLSRGVAWVVVSTVAAITALVLS